MRLLISVILGSGVTGENSTPAVTSSPLGPCRLTAEKVRNRAPDMGRGMWVTGLAVPKGVRRQLRQSLSFIFIFKMYFEEFCESQRSPYM